MITGYDNGSRGVGIRTFQLILPSVVCSTHLSKKVADQVGAITFAHQHGCAIIGPDVAGVNDFFISLAGHPNVYSTLVLGLGCETLQGNEVTASITANYPETKYVVIQESAGMAGALDESIAAANQLQKVVARKDVAHLTIGIEGFPAEEHERSIVELLTRSGHHVLFAREHKEPTRNFAELIRAKCHLILSFPDSNQPPTGLPLIPVITIANGSSPLHQALIGDFDFPATVSAGEILVKIEAVANGEKSKVEAKKIGDIVVPRMVRSV
jgi:altronate dehydratase large subunit